MDTPELRALLLEAQSLLETHNVWAASLSADERRQDVRNMVVLMLSVQGAELGLSAADDFHFGRPIAGAIVGRAILETAVVLRWCVLSEDNANRWWKTGDAVIQKSLRGTGASSDPAVVGLREGPTLPAMVPKLQTCAKAGGLSVPYSRWYPTFSAYTHATRMGAGHTWGPPESDPIPPLIQPTHYFLHDIARVSATWIASRALADAAPHP